MYGLMNNGAHGEGRRLWNGKTMAKSFKCSNKYCILDEAPPDSWIDGTTMYGLLHMWCMSLMNVVHVDLKEQDDE